MPYQISYAHIELSENSENGENTWPTYDNVDENIENSVITPAGTGILLFANENNMHWLIFQCEKGRDLTNFPLFIYHTSPILTHQTVFHNHTPLPPPARTHKAQGGLEQGKVFDQQW